MPPTDCGVECLLKEPEASVINTEIPILQLKSNSVRDLLITGDKVWICA